MDYRVTRVTAHYKGCIYLKSEYSQYIDEFLSMSLCVTGLQGLQHITRVAFSKIRIVKIQMSFLSSTSLYYRVTRVTAHYKGCSFLKSEYSPYIDEFLSMSLWVTGLQGLQHITRVAFFQNRNIVNI